MSVDKAADMSGFVEACASESGAPSMAKHGVTVWVCSACSAEQTIDDAWLQPKHDPAYIPCGECETDRLHSSHD